MKRVIYILSALMFFAFFTLVFAAEFKHYLGARVDQKSTKHATDESAKPSITGSLTLSGSLSGTFSWKPDLALMCMCFPRITPPAGDASVTMTDGTGDFIALEAHTNGEIKLTCGKLKVLLLGKGKTGTCTATGPSALAGKVNLPIDATVTDKGETVTIKGNLVANCP